MTAVRSGSRLESVRWLARAFAGVAGACAAAEATASGSGPLLASLAALVGFGIVYALLLAAIRSYARLLDRAAAADAPAAPEARDPASTEVPRLIRTRRNAAPKRRLMAPDEPPENP